MKIRVLQGFAGYEPGQVFEDWPGGMCEIFIARGMVEKVADSADPEREFNQAADEAAEDTQKTERAEMPARRKRK